MNELIKELENSLIYKMSLGSKELYHSNVWDWIMSLDKDKFVKLLLPDDDNIVEVTRITREEEHRDLSIWVKLKDNSEKCIVIENKLKSIPTVDQLIGYSKKLDKKYYRGFLTGLKKPIIVGDDNKVHTEYGDWDFITYNDFCNIIEKFVTSIESKLSNQNKLLILEYINNNRCVEKIVNKNIKSSVLEPVENKSLDNLGIQDLINKIIGSDFVSYVEKRFKEDEIKLDHYGNCPGFHNKSYTLDFVISNKKDFAEKRAKHLLSIGIQIEGNQYRRFVETDCFSSKDELFEKLADSNYGFFDSNYEKNNGISFPNDVVVGKRQSSMIKKYDKYGEKFVYQYSNLDTDGLDYETIYLRIKNDLLLSEKIFKDIIDKYNIY